jgi:RNA polymerase sigma-70 factor (ECF subfamily)
MARVGRPAAADQSESGERQMIAAAQRDPRHFAELYDAHFERVYAYAMRRVRDRAEAQDVTSEVFHQALQNLKSFEWRGVPFSAWLYRIAANAIADRAIKASREQTVQATPEAVEEVDFGEIEERAQIFKTMEDLPADQRRVLEMRFVEEQSIREIAKELSRSEGAVKQLQFRALQNLRDRLREKMSRRGHFGEQNV